MAFAESSNTSKKSTAQEFDIERFSYDVFSYMLRLCGYPEAKIPTSSLKENTYAELDFVRNVGLSALPIGLYFRDEWRPVLERVPEQIKNNIDIEQCIEPLIDDSVCNSDDLRAKIQFSFAYSTELALFLDSVGVEISFYGLLKQNCFLFKDLLGEIEMFAQEPESPLAMNPEISESWIKSFLERFAIPYGISSDVSERFVAYIEECPTNEENHPKQKSVDDISHHRKEDSVSRPIGMSNESSKKSVGAGRNSKLSHLPGASRDSKISKASFPIETGSYSSNTNGLNYVRQHSLKRKEKNQQLGETWI